MLIKGPVRVYLPDHLSLTSLIASICLYSRSSINPVTSAVGTNSIRMSKKIIPILKKMFVLRLFILLDLGL
tara:strand:+ start:1086 stop:1298 length:213 start_codon:yes stop_codon:yes gene_type:complete